MHPITLLLLRLRRLRWRARRLVHDGGLFLWLGRRGLFGRSRLTGGAGRAADAARGAVGGYAAVDGQGA